MSSLKSSRFTYHVFAIDKKIFQAGSAVNGYCVSIIGFLGCACWNRTPFEGIQDSTIRFPGWYSIVFSRSQFSPSMRRCPKYLGLGTWWVEGHGMFILFPQSFSCPRKPLFLRVVAQKSDSQSDQGKIRTTRLEIPWPPGMLGISRVQGHGLFSI